MRLLGMVENGIYIDDCEGLQPDIISQYYGTHGDIQSREGGETGAGSLLDEDIPILGPDVEVDKDDWQEFGEDIEAAQATNFHHDAVGVPKHADPFIGEHKHYAFQSALAYSQEHGMIPSGYGLLHSEWDEDSYPSFEILRSGQHGGKELRIAMPDFIWRPRAELWGQALDILNHLKHIRGSTE